jgi:uncharacterized protein (DUF58 family)
MTIERLYVRTRTALGLLERDREFPLNLSIKVYPSIGNIKRFELLVRRLRLRQMGLRPQRIRGKGMEFEKLREYHPDDEFRQIDWKASARRDRLISRDYQVERSQTIVAMIDAGRMMLEESRGVPKIEYALKATLLLTHVAARYDDRIGVIVFSDEVQRFVAPMKGRIALSRIADAIYDVQAKAVEANYERAFEYLAVRQRRRALVVLLTNIVDNVVSSLAMGCLSVAAHQHVPLCAAVMTDEVRDVADAAPREPEDVYRKSAAKFYLLGRARTLSRLERRGVLVVDAPCGDLPAALVNKYLDLKARRLL